MKVTCPRNTSSTPLSACASGFRVFIVVVAFLASGPAAAAAEPRPSWECLPGETLFMARVPGAKAFAEAVGSRTKFGAVLMQPERLRKLARVVLDRLNDNADENVLEEMSKRLGRHGLSPDDLAAAVSGEFGAAAIAQGPGGSSDRPLLLLVGWLESSGEEAAGRLFNGIASLVEEAIEEADDGTVAATRTDLDMAGRPTIWVRTPIVAEGKRLGTTHLFVTRMGHRLLFAGTMAVAGGQMQMSVKLNGDGIEVEPKFPEDPPSPEETDRIAEAIGERAREAFEGFLVRHGEADGGSPLANLVATPAMQAALPAGVPLVEVLVNPPVAANMLGKEQAAAVSAKIAPFGIDSVGPIAWRQSLDGDVWRSHAFVTLPAPRHGLARILDEEAARAEVPAFVSREPIGFQQVSLDLGRAYAMLREAVLGGEEPAPGNAFSTAETMAITTAGMELADLLSALGTRHWFVSYPPRITEAVAHARRVKAGGEAAAEPAPNPNPAAIVWQVKDEKPFAKLLEFAGQAGGGKVVEEQGFRSVRFPAGMSVFLGQGHLVLAMGDGVAEKTLAAIRNPPSDDAAFRTSDTVRLAGELIPPRAGGLYAVADNRKTGGGIGVIVTMLAASSPDDVEEEARDFFRSLQSLLPSPQEMEGMLGAATAVWRADDDGIVMQSASEMPAP
jgi:hypothetical protein